VKLLIKVEAIDMNGEDTARQLDDTGLIVGILHSLLPSSTSLTVNEETDLFAVGLDSLKAVEFLLAIEDVYNVVFDLSEINMNSLRHIRTVRSLVASARRDHPGEI